MKLSDPWMNEMLLDQAGELSAWRRWRLRRRMRLDPALQREQQRLRRLQQAVQAASPDVPVSDFCMSRIRMAAEQQLRREPGPSRQWRTWYGRPALAYGGLAVLLLLIGLWFRSPPAEDWSKLAVHPVETAVEWMPIEWDAIFAEISLDIEVQLNDLWMELSDVVVWVVDGYEEEWARELLEMETST